MQNLLKWCFCTGSEAFNVGKAGVPHVEGASARAPAGAQCCGCLQLLYMQGVMSINFHMLTAFTRQRWACSTPRMACLFAGLSPVKIRAQRPVEKPGVLRETSSPQDPWKTPLTYRGKPGIFSTVLHQKTGGECAPEKTLWTAVENIKGSTQVSSFSKYLVGSSLDLFLTFSTPPTATTTKFRSNFLSLIRPRLSTHACAESF